jgi:hypothetical protein
MLFLAAAVALASPPAVLWTAGEGEYATNVENIGDINGNGTQDIAVTLTGNASLICVEGLTGEIIWSSTAMETIPPNGAMTAIPDVDGDGFSDIALGMNESIAAVISGIDGSVIWQRDTPAQVLAVSCSASPTGLPPIVHFSYYELNGYTFFLALNGASGDSLWCYQTWTDDMRLPVIPDINGNGWGEAVVCHDRGSAYSGFNEVIDGYTREQLCYAGTIYFGSADAVDTPVPILGTYSWGQDCPISARNIFTGDTLYAVGDEYFDADTLSFIDGVSGGTVPFPVLAAWSGTAKLSLIGGMSAEYLEEVTYSSGVVLPMGYQESESVWKLAVLTGERLYITEPTSAGILPGPSCALPAQPGGDLCLVESQVYPGPIAAVSMLAPGGPGVCGIALSWPEGTEENPNTLLPASGMLLQNPCAGGVLISADAAPSGIMILDLTGRQVAEIPPADAAAFIELPPGIYHVVALPQSSSSVRAVVLP